LPDLDDIALTTNGTELPRLARDLADAGLERVNVSLDSLDPRHLREARPARPAPDVLRRHRSRRGPPASRRSSINCVVIRGNQR